MEFSTLNPHDEEVLNTYKYQDLSEVEALVDDSFQAFQQWKFLSPSERVKCLEPLLQLLEDHKKEAAKLMCLEMGKPYVQAIAEVDKCISIVSYYLENGPKFLDDASIEAGFFKSYVSYQPLGVILGIMPWNFPFLQVIRFAIPTLIAGNTVVVKHAPNVQGSMDLLSRIFLKTNLPNFVFQSFQTQVENLEEVIAHKKIQGVSLTGSERAGRSVANLCGENLKKCVLELGGSDAFLVLKGAPIKKAIKSALRSRLINNGQSCVAAKRFIVHKSLKEEFIQGVQRHLSRIKYSDPSLESCQLGPIARKDLLINLEEQVNRSCEEGARCLLGGKREAGIKGFYYPVTLLDKVTESMTCFKEEVFGPVMSVVEFDSLEEGVHLANSSRFGLGGAIFSENLEEGERVARDLLDTGGVFVNDLYRSTPELPFGGIKASGLGRELSFLGIKEFTNAKTIAVVEN